MRDWRSAMARPIFDEIAARLAREPSVSAREMNHRHFVFLADWARIKNFVADCRHKDYVLVDGDSVADCLDVDAVVDFLVDGDFVADCLDVDADGGLVGGHLYRGDKGDPTAGGLHCCEFSACHCLFC